ncbi:MAG: hypothetical protein GTN78_24505 [Gemmatimonadales bacterium]|nr:hypothetical protein [Gemmatimonadales bacterium]NIN12089.1 hypothetical protein [Gemmatimonadales bacterium]NIR03324.1 hypothetical protein [Gemmatimonadales bacterium]NIS67004.1 hypothetical protein [Gemmatimonadales bacterium]
MKCHKIRRRVGQLGTLAALVLFPLAARAQEQADSAAPAASPPCAMGRMMQSGMMSGGMMGPGMTMGMPAGSVIMRAMRFHPAHLVALQEQLALTPEQVAQLEALPSAHRQGHQEKPVTSGAELRNLEDAFRTERPDTAAVRVAAERLFQQHAAWHAQMLADAAAARGVLSEEQRDKVPAMSCGMERM